MSTSRQADTTVQAKSSDDKKSTPPDLKNASDQKSSTTQLKTIAPIIITYAKIKDAINEYARQNLISWDSWVGNYFGKKLANTESELTKKLHTILPSSPYSDSTQLNTEQLFELAYMLYPTLKEKNSCEIEAITPLTKILGLMRIRMTHTITHDKKKSLHYFRILCQIPEEQVFYAGMIFGLETQNVTLYPETIELIVKNSHRLKELFDLSSPILENCGLSFTKLTSILSTSAFVISFITSIIPNDYDSHQTIISNLINQIITSAFSSKTHVIDICYAILWLANHNINTVENQTTVAQNAENLVYLSHIGMTSYISTKKIDPDFNQRLFKFAIEEGKKAVECKGKMFSNIESDIKATEKTPKTTLAVAQPLNPALIKYKP